MPNAIASIALMGWPLVTLALFQILQGFLDLALSLGGLVERRGLALAALEAIPVGPSMTGERSKPLEDVHIVTVEIIEG